jgi:hypothetical protein
MRGRRIRSGNMDEGTQLLATLLRTAGIHHGPFSFVDGSPSLPHLT